MRQQLSIPKHRRTARTTLQLRDCFIQIQTISARYDFIIKTADEKAVAAKDMLSRMGGGDLNSRIQVLEKVVETYDMGIDAVKENWATANDQMGSIEADLAAGRLYQ